MTLLRAVVPLGAAPPYPPACPLTRPGRDQCGKDAALRLLQRSATSLGCGVTRPATGRPGRLAAHCPGRAGPYWRSGRAFLDGLLALLDLLRMLLHFPFRLVLELVELAHRRFPLAGTHMVLGMHW